MDALTPPQQPEPRVALAAAPEPPATLVCAACGAEAVVHWRRRPTDAELAGLIAAEQERRDERLMLADPQLPPPVFPPLPAADNTTITVYSCGSHAITMDAAAFVHASSCTAPNDDHLPECDCSPEPHPEPAPVPAQAASRAASRLPAHWQTEGD